MHEKVVATSRQSLDYDPMKNVKGLDLAVLAVVLLSGCGETGQTGTEGGSIRGCTMERGRRTLAQSELTDGGTPEVLTALRQTPAEGRFGWVDSTGTRQLTTAHVAVESDFSNATTTDWGTAAAGAAACPSTVEYGATLQLKTDDGAFDERVAGSVTTTDGLIEFRGVVESSGVRGAFAEQATAAIHVYGAWSGGLSDAPSAKPKVELRKLELNDSSGDVEYAALSTYVESSDAGAAR